MGGKVRKKNNSVGRIPRAGILQRIVPRFTQSSDLGRKLFYIAAKQVLFDVAKNKHPSKGVFNGPLLIRLD